MNTIQGEKYLWRYPSVDTKISLEFAAAYNISLPVINVLAARGIASREKLDSFFFTSYEKDVFHPSLLQDAQKSVDRILKAIDTQEKILIFGDYDVDGITASALMLQCLLPLNANINFFLPHRMRDGYGLSTKIVERAAKNGYSLIVTVDNGITAFEPALRAQELGIDLIITDHHKPHHDLPKAYAIVNPHRDDCEYPYKFFAGVGVIFKVLSLLYEKKGLEIPERVYELLLLGTIADVVPLTGENRFWVRHCLQKVNEKTSYALHVLKQNAKFAKPRLRSKDVGFAVAPQLNALGRLEDPRRGVKFLLSADKNEIDSVGGVLVELNKARREIERSIFNEVVAEIDAKKIDLEHENCIIAASSQWSPGVIGLVASRLVGAYGKPTILLHLTDTGIAKGSCRSIPEFNMFEALQSAEHLLHKFGGHALAAGLSLPVDSVAILKEHLEKRIASMLTPLDLQPKLTLGAEVKLEDLTKKFMQDMDYLEPFGNENEEPLFYIKKVSLVQKPVLLKDAHVKCKVFLDGIIKPIIFFNRPELFELLINLGEEPFDVAVNVHENYWNDRVNIELIGLDIAKIREER